MSESLLCRVDNNRDIKIGYTVIEQVDSYLYVEHKLKYGLDNQTAEIERRIGPAWQNSG